MRMPPCLGMAELPDNNPMPDLRTTTDARIPTNITPMLGECIECDGPCHEYINLTGGDGGNTLVCLPCYANYLNDDKIPYDEWAHVELPYSPETIARYDMKPLGINQTLECGCILTDLDGGEKYITLCSTHRIFLDAKILMTELANIGPNGDCKWCDRLGHNCDSCGDGWGMTPCEHCWGVHGADITPEWTARVESSGCDCNSWGA